MSGHLPTHAPVLLPYGSGSLSLFFVKAFLVNCFISDPHHYIDLFGRAGIFFLRQQTCVLLLR